MKSRGCILSRVGLVCAIVATALLGGCGPSAADAAKMSAALDAAARLKSKVEAGVLYADYTKAVGDAKGEVDLFTSSSVAKTYPETASELTQAMDAYVAGTSVWESTKGGRTESSWFPGWADLVQEYPDLTSAVTDAPWSTGSGSAAARIIDGKKALQVLWSDGGKHVDAAQAAASK
jgi:hypothetical protein